MSTNITLRGEKGEALTYAEMDENFVSYFYSASLNEAGTELILYRQSAGHITGSNVVSHREFRINLVPVTGSAPVTGSSVTSDGANGVIQLSDGSGGFNSNSVLSADPATGNVGIGETPTSNYRLKVTGNSTIGGIVQHKSIGSGAANWAFSEYRNANTLIARVGKISSSTNNTYWHTFENSSVISTNAGHRVIGAQNGVVIGNDAYTNRGPSGGDIGDLVVVGPSGLSITGTQTDKQSVVRPIAQEATLNGKENDFYSNTSDGLLLAGAPGNKGNVVIGVNADSGYSEAFAVIGTHQTTGNTACYTTGHPIMIGKLTSTNESKVVINGCISQACQETLTVLGSSNTTGDVFVGDMLAVTGSIELLGGFTGSTALSASYDATDIGTLVQRVDESIVAFDAAPIPKGGIIMWSGAISDIPSGWQLCDGTGTTPDLTDKFVIGATADGADTNYPDMRPGSTGGSDSHSHGGATQGTTLTVNQIPAHTHDYQDSYYLEKSGTFCAVDGIWDANATGYLGSARSDTDNRYGYYRCHTTSPNTTTNLPHSHVITSATHLPPFYALAFIMYIG